MDNDEVREKNRFEINQVVGKDDILTLHSITTIGDDGGIELVELSATVESKYCTCTGTLWYKDSYGKVTCSKCKKLIEGFDMPSPEKLIGAERVELLKKYGYEIVDNN